MGTEVIDTVISLSDVRVLSSIVVDESSENVVYDSVLLKIEGVSSLLIDDKVVFVSAVTSVEIELVDNSVCSVFNDGPVSVESSEVPLDVDSVFIDCSFVGV